MDTPTQWICIKLARFKTTMVLARGFYAKRSLLCTLVLGFWASLISFASAETVTLKDYKRIVSIGSSSTEIIYALGLEHNLVAVDTTSLYPEEALKTYASVGYMRALSAEPILSLAPDIVVSEASAQPAIVLQQMREAGVKVLLLPEDRSIQGVYEKISLIADTFGREQKAQALITQLKLDFQRTQEYLANLRDSPKTLFLLGISSSAITASGSDTSAHDLITYAGGSNAFSNFRGYLPVTAESIIEAAPEVIILPSHSIDLAGGLAKILAIPEIRLTPAGQNERIYIVDSTMALGYGPRLPEAIRIVAEQIHQLQENILE